MKKAKLFKTIKGKLIFDNSQDIAILKDLTRRWSSAYRYAYKRLLEGMSEKELRPLLMRLFRIDSWYSFCAIERAKWLIRSRKELGLSLRKIKFGGEKIFRKLQKRHINGKAYEELRKQWKERREGNLYSIGQAYFKGNKNLRIEVKDGNLFLRINIGTRKYIYARITSKGREDEIIDIALSGMAYSVGLSLENGEYHLRVTAEEKLPPIEITKANGVIGIDLNAYPHHMAWVEVDKYGNFLSYGEIPMPELSHGNANRRQHFAWDYVHKITDIAKEKGKAIVIEKLKMNNKGKRGDYSGRKNRRIRHEFPYKRLVEMLKITARRKGIEVIEVNPAYTSIIGTLKYAPLRMISKDIAAAYVISRRGLGLKEKVPKNYMEFIKSLSLEELYELREYIKEQVRNKNLREAHLRAINSLIQSLESESERVSKPLVGTSLNTQGESLNLWQVLKVVGLATLSPKASLRNVSVLKKLLLLREAFTKLLRSKSVETSDSEVSLRDLLLKVRGETRKGTAPVSGSGAIAYG